MTMANQIGPTSEGGGPGFEISAVFHTVQTVAAVWFRQGGSGKIGG